MTLKDNGWLLTMLAEEEKLLVEAADVVCHMEQAVILHKERIEKLKKVVEAIENLNDSA